MKIGSLFSGIGGFELGFEAAELGQVIWQVEIDEFCLKVLRKRWSHVKKYTDVRTMDGTIERPDLICGGFPCQDISSANVVKRHGLQGDQSGLWREFYRITRLLRPRWVVIENVDGGKERASTILKQLNKAGYHAKSISLDSKDVGAPHSRRRRFVVATHADSDSEPARALDAQVALVSTITRSLRKKWRKPSPRALGVADGVPDRMDRLGAVGNAVMPIHAQTIGILIKNVEEYLHDHQVGVRSVRRQPGAKDLAG